MTKLIIFIIFGYLSGSIPFGYLAVKLRKGVDIRKIGSGATGGTNVGRALGKKWGIGIGLLDMTKAAIPVALAARFLAIDWQIGLVVLAAVLGHIYPIFLKFKGGKGVSVTIGGLLPILGWKIILIALLIFLPILLILKISSVASLTFSLFLPLILYKMTSDDNYLILGFLLFAIIWWAHRENIKRLIAGKEHRSGVI